MSSSDVVDNPIHWIQIRETWFPDIPPDAGDIHFEDFTIPADLAANARNIYLLGRMVHAEEITKSRDQKDYLRRYRARIDGLTKVSYTFGTAFTFTQLDTIHKTFVGPGSYGHQQGLLSINKSAHLAVLQTGYIADRLAHLAAQNIPRDAAWVMLALQEHPVRRSELSFYWHDLPPDTP